MTRLSFFTLLCVLTVLMMSGAQTAHADPRGWFGRFVNGLFGDIRTGPSPENTGVASFVSPDQMPTPNSIPLGTTEAVVPLNKAHLDDVDLVAWATEQVIAGLTLHPNDLSPGKGKRATQLSENFTGSGRADLAKFFAPWGGEQNLIAKGFETSAFTTHIPGRSDVQNKGVFGDVYRWLVDIPVTVTVLPAGQNSYRGAMGTQNVTTKTYTIRVQVGRAPTNKGAPTGAVIERFTVLPSLG